MKSRMITKITNPKKVVTPFVERHSRRLSGREYFLLMKRHGVKETRGYKVVLLGSAFNSKKYIEVSMPNGYTNEVHKTVMKISEGLFLSFIFFFSIILTSSLYFFFYLYIINVI